MFRLVEITVKLAMTRTVTITAYSMGLGPSPLSSNESIRLRMNFIDWLLFRFIGFLPMVPPDNRMPAQNHYIRLSPRFVTSPGNS
jgi:hypothetical protein